MIRDKRQAEAGLQSPLASSPGDKKDKRSSIIVQRSKGQSEDKSTRRRQRSEARLPSQLTRQITGEKGQSR